MRMHRLCSIELNRQVLTVILLLLCFASANGFRCKWSNEGCQSDDECCSKRCELPHPGTNARCSKSALYSPCIFHYQCAERLRCSRKRYECCSPYWGTCTKRTDCCNTAHLCLPAEGFTYSRCLFQQVTSTAKPASQVDIGWTMTSIGVFLSHLFTMFSRNSTFTFPFNVTGTTKSGR